MELTEVNRSADVKVHYAYCEFYGLVQQVAKTTHVGYGDDDCQTVERDINIIVFTPSKGVSLHDVLSRLMYVWCCLATKFLIMIDGIMIIGFKLDFIYFSDSV